LKAGILGGGQLGRMLALAGYPLGLTFRVLDPAPDACAGQVAEHTIAAFDDEAALRRFAEDLDVVTYEWENVPVETVSYLSRFVRVDPGVQALEVSQDRLLEKSLFRKLGVLTAPYAPVDTLESLRDAVEVAGLPAILKTRRLGYDGRGQVLIRDRGDIEAAWAALEGVPSILEGFVPFRRELSILAVRGRDSQTAFYPLPENVHRGGILRTSRAPAPQLGPSMQLEAEIIARRVLEALDYVGVLAIELFEHDGRLLANEMAPRVHNSGHWTIEGSETSQFENHLRAICGLPLGSTAPRGHSVMVNLIGHIPAAESVLREQGAHLHLYGKEPRPGRKVGHITVCSDDPKSIESSLSQIGGLIESESA
jgi:5-(carboxyamino)imidazole ribonucleotide synthase